MSKAIKTQNLFRNMVQNKKRIIATPIPSLKQFASAKSEPTYNEPSRAIKIMQEIIIFVIELFI